MVEKIVNFKRAGKMVENILESKKCPKCGKKFDPRGYGPHIAHCQDQIKIKHYIRLFERNHDGTFHCPWCSETRAFSNAQGLGSHSRQKHSKQLDELHKTKNYSRKKKNKSYRQTPLKAFQIKTDSSTKSLRAKIYKKKIGIDLTGIPFEKLPLLAKFAKEEAECRMKSILANF